MGGAQGGRGLGNAGTQPNYGSGVGGPMPQGQSGPQPGWMQGLSNLRSSLPQGLQGGQGLGGLQQGQGLGGLGAGQPNWAMLEEMQARGRFGNLRRGHNRGGRFNNQRFSPGASAVSSDRFAPEQLPITTGASVAGTQSSPATTTTPGAQAMTAPSSNTGAQPVPSNQAGEPGAHPRSPHELVKALRARHGRG